MPNSCSREAKEFEEWVESRGKAFVEESLKKVFLRGFRGETRAKGNVRTEIEDAIRSEILRTSIQQELEKLPGAVLDVASNIAQKGPQDLVWGGYPDSVVVCPRGLIRERYVRWVGDVLRDSSELSRFTGFAEVFLRRLAQRSEDTYFSGPASSAELILPGLRAMLVGTDDTFGWDLYGMAGHYYVAMHSGYGKLESNREIKEFVKRMLTKVQDVKAALGRMSSPTISDLKSRLPAP